MILNLLLPDVTAHLHNDSAITQAKLELGETGSQRRR